MLDTTISRGREIGRAWKEWEPRIVAALPELRGGPAPLGNFLAQARSRLEDAALAACSPDAIAAAVLDAAEAGIAPGRGSIRPLPGGGAAWLPQPGHLRELIARCFADVWLRADVVRPGDHWKPEHDHDGRIRDFNHHREGGPDREFDQVYARASVTNGWKTVVVLPRAEAERLAARHLTLPAAVSAEDTALYVAWILLIHRLDLVEGYAPVRRLQRVVGNLWRAR